MPGFDLKAEADWAVCDEKSGNNDFDWMCPASSVEVKVPAPAAFQDEPLDRNGMDESQKAAKPNIGFLAVRQREPHGFFGGYLVVNSLARPMEFHCTLPVVPSRAQCILFGATLDEYVCGEQIARALLQKSSTPTSVVLTDCPAALAVRHWLDVPVLYLETTSSADVAGSEFAIPSFRRPDHQYSREHIRGLDFLCLESYASDLNAIQRIPDEAFSLDVQEPFQRIIEALLEAHPKIRAA